MGTVCIKNDKKEDGFHSLELWFRMDRENDPDLESYEMFIGRLLYSTLYNGYSVKRYPCEESDKIGRVMISGIPEANTINTPNLSSRFWKPFNETIYTTVDGAKTLFIMITAAREEGTPLTSWCCGFNG